MVTEAVGKAWRLRGGLATGWPCWPGWPSSSPIRCAGCIWIGWAWADSVRRLIPRGRAYVVAGNFRVQKAGGHRRCELFADQAAQGLTRGWSDEIRRTARSAEDALPDRVDRAIATTDLDLAQHR